MKAVTHELSEVPTLLRGEVRRVAAWSKEWLPARAIAWLAVIVVCTASFGAAIGCWRSPLQAAYTAAKLPLLILTTTFLNALLNAMLAPLLGVNVGLRQSLLAVLMSYTIAAAVLGAASPLVAFLVWNMPPLSLQSTAGETHAALLMTIVAAIAIAGVAANVRLFQLLERLGGSQAAARRVLAAWLVGNLFLGSQISWILRPFVGSPGLAVEFLRADAMHGSFYEAVFRSLMRLLSH